MTGFLKRYEMDEEGCQAGIRKIEKGAIFFETDRFIDYGSFCFKKGRTKRIIRWVKW